MAIDADSVFEVRSGGSDNNGGGFVTGASGTDYSQQNSAQATLTTASVINSTTTIIDVDSGDYTCTDNDVGNMIQITGGTATAGIYEITARSGQQWTLDRSAGTAGQTVVGNMGGAFATPGMLSDVPWEKGNKAWIQGGTTYTLTTSTDGPGGPLDLTNNGNNKSVTVECYTTTRGDDGTAIINAGTVTSIEIVRANGTSGSGNRHLVKGIIADGNNQSSVNGFQGFGGQWGAPYWVECTARNCVKGFFNSSTLYKCVAHDNSDSGMEGDSFFFCVAYDNGGDGIRTLGSGGAGGAPPSPYCCLSYGNSGDGFDLQALGQLAIPVCCTAANNGGDGFRADDFDLHTFIACVSTHNGAYGWRLKSDGRHIFIRCASGSGTNTSGDFSSTTERVEINPVTITGDPWEDQANNDYTPNDTAGAGAAIRDIIDIPGYTANIDLGAVQSTPSGGGGTTVNVKKRQRIIL